MKKKQSHILTIVLLLITAAMLCFTLAKNSPIIKKKYYELKKDIEEYLDIAPQTEEADDSAPQAPLTGYAVFESFNKSFHKKMEDELEGGNERELYKSLTALYKSAKNYSENENRDYIRSGTVKYENITFKVNNVYLTKNKEELPEPQIGSMEFTPPKVFHDENGNLNEGYSYCVVELQVTNTTKNDILSIYTNPAMDIFYLNNEGDIYGRALVLMYASFQPGVGVNLYRLDDFKAGDSYTSSYVFAIQDLALEHFDPCLAVCPPGTGTFPKETTTMVILESIKNSDSNDK